MTFRMAAKTAIFPPRSHFFSRPIWRSLAPASGFQGAVGVGFGVDIEQCWGRIIPSHILSTPPISQTQGYVKTWSRQCLKYIVGVMLMWVSSDTLRCIISLPRWSSPWLSHARRGLPVFCWYWGGVAPRDILLAVFWIHSSRRTFFSYYKQPPITGGHCHIVIEADHRMLSHVFGNVLLSKWLITHTYMYIQW